MHRRRGTQARIDRRRQTRGSRVALAVAVALTLALLVLDLAGLPGPAQLRSAGAAALGPLERALSVAPADEGLVAERDRLAVELARARAEAADREALERLVAGTQVSVVPARVVATGGSGPGRAGRLTVDAGTRDGLRVGQAVVSGDGLVGRTVSCGPWTCDVAAVGGPEVVVAVSVGSDGRLGTVGGRAASLGGADLPLRLAEAGSVAAGDEVRTLGSAGDGPYPPGLLVGRVSGVDPQQGRLAGSGTVTPAVDVTALRVVGVVVTTARDRPRPTVEPSR